MAERAASAESGFEEDFQPAFVPTASADAAGSALPASGDDEGPPLEELETQMRGELAAREGPAAASPAARRKTADTKDDDDEGAGGKTALPELDALVAQIPAEVRETLDELFRARFVSVKKLPQRLFQAPSTKGAASRTASDAA